MTYKPKASELAQEQLYDMIAHLDGPQNTIYASIRFPELLNKKADGLAAVLGGYSICALSEGNDGLGGDFPSKLPAEHAANLAALLMSVHAQGGQLEVQKVLSKTLESRPELVKTIAAVGDAIAHDQTGRIDLEKQKIAAQFSETMKTVIPEGLTGKRATVVPKIVKRTVDTIAIHPKAAAATAATLATIVTPVMNAAPAYAAPNSNQNNQAMVATEARSQQSDIQPENKKDVKDKEVDPSEISTNPVVNTLEPAQMENTNIPDAQKDINTADILVKASSIPDNTDKENASNTSTATPSTKKEQTGGSKSVPSNQEKPLDKNNGNDIADEKREDSPTTPAAPKAETPITDSVTAPVLNRPPASETPGSSGDKTSVPGNSGDAHEDGEQDTPTETPTKDTNVSHQPVVAPVQQVFDNVMAMVGGNGQGVSRSEETRQNGQEIKQVSLDDIQSTPQNDAGKTVAEDIVGSAIIPVAQSLPGAGMPDVVASVVEGVVTSSPGTTQQEQVPGAWPLAAAFGQINVEKPAEATLNPAEISIEDTQTTTSTPGNPTESGGFDLSDFISPAFKEIIESQKGETTLPEQTPAPTPPAEQAPAPKLTDEQLHKKAVEELRTNNNEWSVKSIYVEVLMTDPRIDEKLATAFVGNFLIESGNKPDIQPGNVQANGQGHGAGQWEGDRFANLVAFAEARETTWQDPTTQALFVLEEITKDSYESKQFGRILEKKDALYKEMAAGYITAEQVVSELAKAVSDYYERPGTPHLDWRKAAAKKTYSEYSNIFSKLHAENDAPPVEAKPVAAPELRLDNLSPRIAQSTVDKIKNDPRSVETRNEISTLLNTAIEYAIPHAVPRYNPVAADPDMVEQLKKIGRNVSPRARVIYDCFKSLDAVVEGSAVDNKFNPKGLATTEFFNDIKENGAGVIGEEDYEVIKNPAMKDLRPGDIFLRRGHIALWTDEIKGDDGNTYRAIEAALKSNRVFAFRSGNEVYNDFSKREFIVVRLK